MDTRYPPFGESRLQEILDAIIEYGDELESHYLELKVEVDISKAVGRAKLAKFILGAGNRLPEVAETRFGGYALMVIGATQGRAAGVEHGIEILHVKQAVEPYIGPKGPRIELERIRLNSGRHVLFLTVEPPKQGDPIRLCRRNFQGNGGEEAAFRLMEGGIYVRNDGNTSVANAVQVEALLRRMDVTPALDLNLDIEGMVYSLTEPKTARDQYLEKLADEYRASMRSDDPLADILPRLSAWQRSRPDRRPSAVEARLRRWHRQAVEAWPDTEKKLLGLLGDGLRFRVSNRAESFLERVTVIITFHEAQGVMWRDCTDKTQWDEVVEPVDEQLHPFGLTNFYANSPASVDYPVQWENQDGNLVLTITLDSLPPEPDWISENDDVVLIRAVDSDQEVRVTWTATASGYGTAFRGEMTVEAAPAFNPAIK